MVAISEVRGQLANVKNLGSGLVAVFGMCTTLLIILISD